MLVQHQQRSRWERSELRSVHAFLDLLSDIMLLRCPAAGPRTIESYILCLHSSGFANIQQNRDPALSFESQSGPV